MKKAKLTEFSGLNANDQGDALMRRLQAMGVVETPVSVNTEFYPDGIGRRKGHSAHEFTAAIGNALIAGDSAIAVASFMRFDQSRRITVAVGKKTIYANPANSASFHQVQRAKCYVKTSPAAARTESTPYEHHQQASVASIIEFEGHAIIATGNNNPLQVYTSAFIPKNAFLNVYGPNDPDITSTSGVTLSAYVLDCQATGRFSATASGTTDKMIAFVSSEAISRFRPYDFVRIHEPDVEFATIKSISTASAKVTYDFSASNTTQVMDITNRFVEFYRGNDGYSATARRFTGVWNVGYELIERLHDRIVYGKGDNFIEYTPSYYAANSGIWDASAGGFFVTPAPVRAMRQFVPEGGGDMNAHIYMFTDGGVVSRPGMSDFDEVVANNSNSAVLNKDCVAQIENWLVYLTRDKQLRAVNGRMDIDIGRRLKSRDGTSGPLDAMDVTRSEATAFLFYDPKKKKLYANFSSATAFFNDRQAVLDFELGEPVLGEPLESFERRVRCLDWRIDTPTANEGFCTMAQIGDEVVGFKQNGTAWKLNDGNSDFGANKIAASWYTPQLTNGDPTVTKHWRTTRVAMMNTGPHTVTLSKRANRQATDVDMGSFEVSDPDGIKIYTQEVNQHKYAMQLGVRNENSAVSEPWILTAISQDYTADTAEF